jgi:predicted small lipoprotein YifL
MAIFDTEKMMKTLLALSALLALAACGVPLVPFI